MTDQKVSYEEIAYSNMMSIEAISPNELLVHFPSLEKWLKPRLIQANSLMKDTFLKDTYGDLLQVTNGEWTS